MHETSNISMRCDMAMYPTRPSLVACPSLGQATVGPSRELEAVVRFLGVLLVQAALLAAAGCGSAGETVRADGSRVPTAVMCSDAPQLRQQALDERRRTAELKSDRGRIISGNRAKFFASLATIAELTCAVATIPVDEDVRNALDAARAAEATSSEYDAAINWAEADLIASDVVARLVSQLSRQPSR